MPIKYSSPGFKEGQFHIVQICSNGGVHHISKSVAKSPLEAFLNVHNEHNMTKFHRDGAIYLVTIPDSNPNGFPCLFEFDPLTNEITPTIL